MLPFPIHVHKLAVSAAAHFPGRVKTVNCGHTDVPPVFLHMADWREIVGLTLLAVLPPAGWSKEGYPLSLDLPLLAYSH